jgi:hypothetical protein
MSLLRLVPVAATLTVIGCTSADVLRLDRTPRPETRPESIQLIAQEPQQPYTVIAIISARAQLRFGDARERLLKEAAKLGGDAILLDTASLTRVGGDDSERTQITGKVIVFDRTSRSN